MSMPQHGSDKDVPIHAVMKQKETKQLVLVEIFFPSKNKQRLEVKKYMPI